MSRHKFNLIEECKNNRVKNVMFAFIRASATRGRDGGGRLDIVGSGVGWTAWWATSVDDKFIGNENLVETAAGR